MPRCTPCTAFADFAEVPPAPQLDRKWSSRAEVIDSARAGCDLCTLCWQYADVWASEEEYLKIPMRLHRFHGTNERIGLVPFILDTGGSSQHIDANKLRYKSPPLEAEEDPISQARQLLSRCLSSHGGCGKIEDAGLDEVITGSQDSADHCGTKRSLPRRLLDLSQGSDVLVIDVEAWILDGTISVAGLSQYCTLSYRWGDAPHGCVLGAPFPRQISIEIESMPQTFRDAIETTRRLGIRFLWIDALCIVQPDACGDEKDWNAEGPRMGTIYHNAICTIAATSAHNATNGFLLKTGSERIRAIPCEVVQHMDNGETRTRWLQTCFTDFDRAVTSSALNKRGWVTQEQFLSQRVLHFTLQGVILDCRSTLRHGHSSVLDVFRNRSRSRDVRELVFGKINRSWTEWMEVVEHYSKTEFTNPGDRLVALSSLVRAFDRTLDHAEFYCAGHWNRTLLFDLVWMRSCLPTSETPKRLNIAPTWSWASIQGEMWFRSADIRNRKMLLATSSADVLDIKLVPSQSDNPYGNIREGRIRLVAQVATVYIGTKNARIENSLTEDGGTKEALHLRIENQGSQWYSEISRWIHWDEWYGNRTEEKEYKVVHFQTMHWRDDNWGVIFEWNALIVEQVHGTESEPTVGGRIRTYRRIGVLRDIHYTKDHERLLAEAPTYNYGKSEFSTETLVLV